MPKHQDAAPGGRAGDGRGDRGRRAPVRPKGERLSGSLAEEPGRLRRGRVRGGRRVAPAARHDRQRPGESGSVRRRRRDRRGRHRRSARPSAARRAGRCARLVDPPGPRRDRRPVRHRRPRRRGARPRERHAALRLRPRAAGRERPGGHRCARANRRPSSGPLRAQGQSRARGPRGPARLGAPGSPRAIGIDACSPGEVELALASGWQPGRDQLHRDEPVRARSRRPAADRRPPQPRRDQPDRAGRPTRARSADRAAGQPRCRRRLSRRADLQRRAGRRSSGSTPIGSTRRSTSPGVTT